MKSNAVTGFILLCAFVVCFNTADAGIGFGRCSDKRKAIKNFKLNEYIGRWYEIGSFSAWFEWNGKCVQAQYSLLSDGAVEVVNTMVDKSSLKVKAITGSAKPADKSGDGKLAVTFPVLFGNRTGPYWVLGTDYVNYAVVYSCSDFGIAHYDFGWILSRKQTLDEPYKTEAEKVLAANDLKPTQFSPTVQDCGPVFPIDSVKVKSYTNRGSDMKVWNGTENIIRCT